MSYASWRISYQSSEQAARAAYAEVEALRAERDALARENEAMKRCATKYLEWLGVTHMPLDQALYDDMHNPSMCGDAALTQEMSMTTETSNAWGEWPARYACNGPEGTFWTDDATLANKLIAATFDRDEWTITDTQNPTAAAQQQPAEEGEHDWLADALDALAEWRMDALVQEEGSRFWPEMPKNGGPDWTGFDG